MEGTPTCRALIGSVRRSDVPFVEMEKGENGQNANRHNGANRMTVIKHKSTPIKPITCSVTGCDGPLVLDVNV